MAYKALRAVVTLDNLEEGQVVNIDEYIEKLHFFKKYSRFGLGDGFKTGGTYITDRRYIEFSVIGLHYYKFDTLIAYFEDFKKEYGTNKALIVYNSNHNLQCEPVMN